MTTPTSTHPLAGMGGRARSRRRRRRTAAVLGVLVLVVAAAVGGLVWLRGALFSVPIREHCTATALGQSNELDPEQAGNAAIIAAVAVRRGLPGRAATIGIATARQESKLRNIDYGDRDSLGLFQQRPSQGWGSPEEVMDPVYATNAFYDVLVKVEGYQSLPITTAAQKVQRSAFPEAYGDHEAQARAFASALTGYSDAALTCVLRMPASATGASPSGASSTTGGGARTGAQAVVAAAKQETGRSGSVTSPPAGSGQNGRDGQDALQAAQFDLTGSEAKRTGWALAQWAVARADGLRIVSVATDGRVWRRDRPDQGWVTSSDAPAAGRVVVTVA